MEEADDIIYCTDGSQCEGKGFTYKAHMKKGVPFVCLRCQKTPYGVDIMDFLETKMGHINKSKGDRYRFAIRELIQNADDVEARIVTIRMDRDALYVANDGYPFRPPDKERGWEGDYIRICRVLSRPKAKEGETTGIHGSGFQTVYCFTNHPEVHSSGISARMDPTIANENRRIIEIPPTNKPKFRSPFIPEGVLFRFPWRTENEARKDYDGRTPFLMQKVWPRWDSKERKDFAQDVKGYLHELVLCCKHVEIIRLIWGRSPKAYQVQRIGFSMDKVPDRSYIARVEEGFVDVSDDWEQSFQMDGWKWEKKTSPDVGWRYLVGSGYVRDNQGLQLYYGENKEGEEILTTDLDQILDDENRPFGKRIVMKGNIYVLLPLYDINKRKEGKGTFYKYSVLPIPYPSHNRFACSAHVLVDEDRSSLKLGDQPNMTWVVQVMSSLNDLYLDVFEEYLGILDDYDLSNEEKQQMVMNNIPGGDLHVWIDPKGELEEELKDKNLTMYKKIVEMPILYTHKDPLCPLDAYWADDKTIGLIEQLGGIPFSEGFKGHDMFKRIENELEECKVKDEDILRLWEDFEVRNRKDGLLRLDQELIDDRTLSTDMVKGLISSILGSKNADIRKLPVIPDSDGILQSIDHFPYIPQAYASLGSLIESERRIHDDFKDLVRSIYKKDIGPNDVIRTLSDTITAQKERFLKMDDEDHRLVTEVVVKAVTDSKFALEDVKDCCFIPFEHQGAIHIGGPNKEPTGNLMDQSHIGESYRREHIFKIQRKDVPGMADYIRRGIKILSLPGSKEDDIEKMEKKLRLVALFEKTSHVPTNFVRVYISPKYGSLFNDNTLQDFLAQSSGIPIKEITGKVLEQHKRTLLKGVNAYFGSRAKGTEDYLTKDDMKDVPCLYDSKREWHNAGDFAIEVDETLEMLGKYMLHTDFLTEEWTRETLVDRLGVCESAELWDVVNAIVRYSGSEQDGDREKLKKILGYLLASKIELVDKKGVRLVDRPEMKELEWVPTKDDGIRNPIDCLFPSSTHIDILGESYGGFLDIPPEVYEKSTPGNIEEQAGKIGVPKHPRADDLLRTVKTFFDSLQEPPPKLFDELSSKLRVHEDCVYEGPIYAKAYFDLRKGKWFEVEYIRLMDEPDIPTQLKDRYLFVGTESPHKGYLSYYLDVKRSFFDDEILDYMIEEGAEIDLKLWSFLSRAPRRGLVEEEDYGGRRIFPDSTEPAQLLRPDRIILWDPETFIEPGPWGDWYVLGGESAHVDEGIIKKLKELGTKRAEELTSGTVIDILGSMARTGLQSYRGHYEKMKRLLLNLAKKSLDDDSIILDRSYVPILMEDGFVCKKIRECYLNDTFKAALFRGRLPILDNYIDGELNEDLQRFYRTNGARSLERALRIRPRRRPDAPEEDLLQNLRFRELRKALSIYFERTIKDEENLRLLAESIEWLDHCNVMRYDDIQVDYSVDDVQARSSGFDLEQEDDTYRINIARIGAGSIIRELAREIYKTCERSAPSYELRQRETEMVLIISELLSTDLDDWRYSIQWYRFEGGESPPPLLEIVEFTTEGYFDTRSKLKESYNACQICMTRTPADDSGFESCEMVTSVVTMRGGKYYGTFSKYSPANSLFLCPTHQTLYKRRLIKIPYLEEAIEGNVVSAKDSVDDARARIKRGINEGELRLDSVIEDIWEIYETPVEDFQTSEAQWGWRETPVRFRVEHLLELLDWVSDYIGGI